MSAHRGGHLGTALAASAAIATVEIAGGLFSHSLALLADAAHVSMDVVALGIAVAAGWASRRAANDRRSFGYARFEMLGALANAALLCGATVFIAVEALRRFGTPVHPSAGPMLAFAAVGFFANVAVGLLLRHDARHNLNARAALWHVAGDALGAALVVAGAAAIALTGAAWIDPALSLAVAAIILTGVVGVARDAAEVLLESTPEHARLPDVRARIADVAGVAGVHDVHVWTIGSGEYVLTAHVLVADARISDATAILRAIESRVRDEFAIGHVTVQIECVACADDASAVCTQTERGGGARLEESPASARS